MNVQAGTPRRNFGKGEEIKNIPLSASVKFPLGTMGIVLGGDNEGIQVNTVAMLNHGRSAQSWKQLTVHLENKENQTVKIRLGTTIANLILIKNVTPALSVELSIC